MNDFFDRYFPKIFAAIFTVIVLLILASVVQCGAAASGGNMSFGVGGLVEKRCINGYQFLVGQEGRIQQVLNESGGGVRCQ